MAGMLNGSNIILQVIGATGGGAGGATFATVQIEFVRRFSISRHMRVLQLK